MFKNNSTKNHEIKIPSLECYYNNDTCMIKINK